MFKTLVSYIKKGEKQLEGQLNKGSFTNKS